MSDAPEMAEFGKALVEKTADELKRWLAQTGGMPDAGVSSLMLVIHYTMEITAERLGPAGVAFMLESAGMFAAQALTGEVAG
ncbi:hypothetical protein [Acidisoma cladoniae]|jgi:hypothetical protein|uniref:hypothetical protein n=1 Tax=Acidisoma cladoniae TaxID=3040935 RepID=UPI00254C655D|nr:hypothetical protein [Acidisoma sp. PAMC 29798]